MKLSKRILSAFLAVIMVLATASSIGAANVTFTDVSGHWAWTGGQIQYLVEKNVLNGYKQSNGTYTFNPDGEVTRAEFIKMLDETFGLTATASISYSDVKSSDWFYTYFAKAAAQGYLLNYGNYVSPNGKITREEALSLLVRYLNLPIDQKASPSDFADYSSITENYRDYILRAIYAGLTNGYKESNGTTTFRPKNTLTRAEALTILYRAAGSIFNTNAYSRDSGAFSSNNVITTGGVILNGITLSGRVIISEGASTGTVSLSNCKIADTLYIRGTADVTLDNCDIQNIVISNGCKVSLLNSTEVENLTIEGKSTLGIYSNIKVGTLTVNNGAPNTSVTGDGSIEMAYINASGFSSSMVPAEFQIGNNLTATFASSQYQGSSDAQESFTMTPFITSDDTSYYLNLFPAVDGKVYYYFTNGTNAPSTSAFDSYYTTSSFTGVINVSKDNVVTEKTYAASSVKNFEYVVLQLQEGNRKYAPVMIPNTNTSGTGFSTAPYLSDETTIKFMSSVSGTLYWYYAESGEKLTQVQFLQNYSAKEAAFRSEDSVISSRTISLGLNTKYLANYDFIVMMLATPTGSYYTPVVVSAGDNGFTDAPIVKTVGTVSFKSNITGELYYYYSETDDLPAPDSYRAEYNKAEYSAKFDVTKNRSDTFSYKTNYSDEYPYLIIALRNSDGDYMQPVALGIDYQTGFASEPEVVDEVTIRFKPEDDGEVMYYYSKTETAPTIEVFKSTYSSTANRYKNTVSVSNSYKRIEYIQSYAVNYPYMVFMFVDDQDTEYTPIVLALDAASDTGFKTAPYISGNSLYFKTNTDGDVWYYYSKDGGAVTSSEFEDEYGDASNYYGIETVTAGTLESITLESNNVIRTYPYIVVAFLDEDDEDDKTFHFPIVIDIEEAKNNGSTGITIASVDDDEVTLTVNMDGVLYWYFTDSSANPDDDFEDDYDDSSISARDFEYVDEDDYVSIDVSDSDYDYLVICLLPDDSDDEYLKPVVIDLSEHTADSDLDDGATRSTTGLYDVDTDPRNHTITFYSDYDGEVTVSIQSGVFKSVLGTLAVEEDEDYEFEYTNAVNNQVIQFITGGSSVYICLQLVAGGETYKTVRVEIVE